jgi:hypothetical protein
MSWALVVAVVAHIVVNWKPFGGYFRKPVGLVLILISLVLGGLSFLPSNSPGRRPFMEAFKAIEQSPLNLVAQLAKRPPETLVEELRAEGLRIQNGEQLLSEIIAENGIQNADLLNRIFCVRKSSGNTPERIKPKPDRPEGKKE